MTVMWSMMWMLRVYALFFSLKRCTPASAPWNFGPGMYANHLILRVNVLPDFCKELGRVHDDNDCAVLTVIVIMCSGTSTGNKTRAAICTFARPMT